MQSRSYRHMSHWSALTLVAASTWLSACGAAAPATQQNDAATLESEVQAVINDAATKQALAAAGQDPNCGAQQTHTSGEISVYTSSGTSNDWDATTLQQYLDALKGSLNAVLSCVCNDDPTAAVCQSGGSTPGSSGSNAGSSTGSAGSTTGSASGTSTGSTTGSSTWGNAGSSTGDSNCGGATQSVSTSGVSWSYCWGYSYSGPNGSGSGSGAGGGSVNLP